MEFLAKYKLLCAGLLGIVLVVIIIFVVTKAYWFRAKGSFFSRSRPDFSIATDGVRKVVLDNGMTLLIWQNKAVPKVLVQIAYNIGSYVEQSGERGLAHLIEHMIFKGTEKLSESDIDEIGRKYGASFNAFTSMDVTSYYFETNKNNWKPFTHILADCMKNARFDEQHLASELKAVIQELKMYKDNYWSMMFEKITSLLFPANHPYHFPVIGYKEDLLNLSADNLKRFYEKYYTPDHATLFVIGDVDPEEVTQVVRKEFESIKADHKASIAPFPHLPHELVTQHTRFFEDIKSEQVGFYWRIPGLKDKHEILSSAASFLLGGGEGSRLHRALVDDQKVATGVGVYAQKFMESGVFVVLIEPVAGKIEECRAIVAKEITKAVEHGFADKELEHMTKSKGKSFLQKLQQYQNFTYEWLTSYFATGDEYDIFNRINKFVDIHSKEVQSFIEANLDPLLMNQIDVLPIPESKKLMSEEVKRHSDELDKKIMAKYVRTAPIEEPKYAFEIGEPENLDFVFPKPDRVISLDNGLKVLLRKNGNLPIMSVNCKFNDFFYFSSAKEGLALELMMNMLMEGSTGYTKQDNVDFFEFYGVDYHFGSDGAGLSMLSADYKKIFERFLFVLLNPTFPQNELDKQKAISIDSYVRSKDESTEVGIRELKCMIYKNHPFSWNFDDAIALIKSMEVQQLKALHKKYVNPGNMILSIAGDFDMNVVEHEIREIFSQWKKGQVDVIDYPKSGFVSGEHKDVYMVRDQVVVLFGQPSHVTIYHEDLIPLKMLNYIAFHSLGSRLFQLRQESGLFYTAFGAWGAGAGKDIGFDYVGAILSLDKLDQAEKGIRGLVHDLAEHGVKDHEIAAARQLYLKTLIDAVSTNASVGDLMGTIEAYQLGFDYYDKVLHRVQTISSEELNAIAAKYFTMDNMVRVRVGRIGK